VRRCPERLDPGAELLRRQLFLEVPETMIPEAVHEDWLVTQAGKRGRKGVILPTTD